METIVVGESPELTYIQARTVERAEGPVTRWYFSHDTENRAGYSFIQANEILEQLGVISPVARGQCFVLWAHSQASASRTDATNPRIPSHSEHIACWWASNLAAISSSAARAASSSSTTRAIGHGHISQHCTQNWWTSGLGL